MNPIPIGWCLGGALAAAVAGGLAGWTVRDWKRDSEVLAEFQSAAKDLKQARETVDHAATAYEQERDDDRARTAVRESTIREIYHDRTVPADCAVPAAAVRVLDQAVDAANARTAGQPAPGLPEAAETAGAAD
ncbi:hypothetical protein [Novosphingobium beihaiensis]|uniref:Uncharacterized protein n=1 Tax=Novosphingobium beihaiensis TaxID=2930389 RepID=A0ABT0BW01_9SPHN|nr:hypothetical protein [Novosphingobium beihaiensis]MCJ2189165.1 hypothetical protein [Novosphingobium beihaiensis]